MKVELIKHITTTEEHNLLPCPFCGTDEHLKAIGRSVSSHEYVYEINCSCGASFSRKRDELRLSEEEKALSITDFQASVIAAWNTRTSSSDTTDDTPDDSDPTESEPTEPTTDPTDNPSEPSSEQSDTPSEPTEPTEPTDGE